MSHATITSVNGSPAIVVDGTPFPPMMATIRTNNVTHMCIDKEYYRRLGAAGIKIYFLICDTEWLKPGAIALFREEAEALLEVVPDAWIIPRIGMHPPLSWFEEHPEELVAYSNGKPYPVHLFSESYVADLPAMYELLSPRWQEDASKALTETLNELLKLPCADRIIGVFLGAGNTSEWWYPCPEVLPDGTYNDFSPTFMRVYEQWLRKKYKTVEALRASWNDPEATFEHPRVPTPEERFFIEDADGLFLDPPRMLSNAPVPPPLTNGTNIGSFLDVDHYNFVFDYFRCRHQSVAASAIRFGKAVKAVDPNLLVGAFYGSFGCTNFFQNCTSGGVLDILDSGWIDFLAAPGVYESRQPGGSTGQREMNDSFRLRNRMFIVEEDTRTHMENVFYANCNNLFDLEDTVNVMKRDFGRNICDDLQAWWFDQLLGGRRYKVPEIYDLISRQQEIARHAYAVDRRKKADIAFIFDEESIHVASQATSADMIEMMRNYELTHIGAPVDQYYHNDMARDDFPSYKLYVFFNVFSLTDDERDAIIARLKKDHAVALWMYAPGIINPDRKPQFSADYIGELTGIRTGMRVECLPSKFKVLKDAEGLFKELDKGMIFGTFDKLQLSNVRPSAYRVNDTFVYPQFYADDDQAQSGAYFLATKQSAAAVREMDGWTSVWCGSRYVQAEFFRAVARFAGCHIFSESGDVLYANRRFVCLHASASGKKTLSFPAACRAVELYENKVYGENVTSITFDMLKGETKFFEMIPMDE